MAFDNRNGKDAVGWTFGNYTGIDGEWGEVVTADDIRHTYLGGVVLQSANGVAFSDAQIKHCINVSARYIMQMLDIVLIKTRIKSSVSAQGTTAECP